ncbi:MAG: hypothetical protein ACP5QI_08765, partial [Candidatus Bathyarchaeia archaeon]
MPRGGRRPGAGRPRKIENRPLSISAGAGEKGLALAEALEEKGLKILGEAKRSPASSGSAARSA